MRSWIKPLVSMLLIAALMVASIGLRNSSTGAAPETLVARFASLGPVGYLLFIAVYVVCCVAAVPAWPLTVLAGWAFGWARGTLTVSLASTLGATAAFLVGRFVARDFVQRRIARQPRFAALDRAISRQGFRVTLLLRLSPLLPFNVLNYSLGLTQVRLGNYMLASWLGMLPATLVYVYLGTLAQNVSKWSTAADAGANRPKQFLWVIGLPATIAVAWLLTRAARQALNEATAESALESPTQ